MRTVLVLATLCSALTGCYDTCHPKASPSLVVGTGSEDYTPLDTSDPTYSLVHGPQGGWHVLIGMQATGVDATQIVTAHITGTIDGEVVAENEGAWLTFQCVPEDDGLQASNTFLIYDVDSPDVLDNAETTIHAAVTDSRGKTIEAEVVATIVDDWEE